MRKQGFLMSSTQLPTVLECSSIRINDEDLENMNVREHPRNINFKQFEENSLNGLEGSLSVPFFRLRWLAAKTTFWN
jgi:hypothetical protein